MNIPKGAIRTEAEIHNLGRCDVWEASRKHSQGRPNRSTITGNTGIQQPGHYHYFQVLVDEYYKDIRSMLDRNIPTLNGYNDWFLFSKLEEAEAYLKA